MEFIKSIKGILTILLVFVVSPVVAEFFIELAREQGIYNNPTGTLETAVSWLTNNAYFWFLLPLLAGATIATWINSWITSWKEKAAKIPAELAHNISKVRELIDIVDNFDQVKKSSWWGFIEKHLTDWEMQYISPPAITRGISIDPSQLRGDDRKKQIVSQMLARLEDKYNGNR